jgi:acetyl esterase/lipase
LCFASDYRVDDPAYLILDQPAHFNGRRTGVAGPTPDIHDQMDDIRTAIRTARKDSQCNGIVFVVGSSAGATHTLFAAVTGAQGDDKPDGVVGLSGSYDGSDMTGFKVPIPPAVLSFTHDWESYVDVPIETFPRPSSIISIHNASPAWQSIANVPSTLLICSENDPMPTAQLNDMITALNTAGVPSFTDWPLLSDYQRNIVPGNGHGWDNWLVQCAPGSGTRVRDEVITFLNSLRYPRNLIK